MKSRETLEESPEFPCPCRRISSGRASAWPLVMVLLQLGLKVAAAQGVGPAPQPALPVSEEEPIFRLEAGGPSSLVTGLAFAPDGQTLYVAGWDKIVRVWALDRAKGEFQLDRPATFRVPIGPGLDGAINSLAVSSDAKGEWLAVAGQGRSRHGGGISQTGPFHAAHVDPGGDEARPGPDRSVQHALESPPPSAAAGPSGRGPGLR